MRLAVSFHPRAISVDSIFSLKTQIVAEASHQEPMQTSSLSSSCMLCAANSRADGTIDALQDACINVHVKMSLLE